MNVIELNAKTQGLFKDGFSKISMLESQIQGIKNGLSRDMLIIAESQHEVAEDDTVSLSKDGKSIEILSKKEKEEK